LGIDPVYSDPARPGQNERHERMHRDLKVQQRNLNRFVKEYNHIRLREALGMKTPLDCHDFPSTMKVMKGCQNGFMRYKSYYWVYLTVALKGKYVGAEDQGNGICRVFYRDVFLGYFNENKIRDKQVSIRLSQNLV
jgi:hypothetical protein